MRIYFVPNRRFWLIVGMMAALLIFAAPVLAQDTAPAFNPPSFPDASSAFVNALLAIFATAIASPITATIVSLIKRVNVPFVQNISADTLNLLVAALLSAALWVGTALGHASDVNTIYKLLYAILPFVSGIGANYFSNQVVYNSTKGKMPLLGYARPAKPTVSST